MLSEFFKIKTRSSDDLNAAVFATADEMVKGFDFIAVQQLILGHLTVEYASLYAADAPFGSSFKRASLAELMLLMAAKSDTSRANALILSKAGVMLLLLDPISPKLWSAGKAVSDARYEKLSGLSNEQIQSFSVAITADSKISDGLYQAFLPCWRSVDRVGRVDKAGKDAAVNQALQELDSVFPDAN